MKKTFPLLIFSAILLISCGETTKKNQSKTENQPEVKTVSNESVVHEPAKLLAEFNDKSIGDVYEDYNRIKSALVNSNAQKTGEAAKDLVESTAQLESADELKKAAKTMAETDDLGKQREAFQLVTAEMTELVEGNLASGKLYYQYCPMAFSGKGGFWLSNSKEVMNPYYGDAMLKCGEVRRVIE